MDPPSHRRKRFSLPSERHTASDRAIRWIVIAVLVGLGVVLVPRLPDAWRWLSGKPPEYRPEHPVALDQVDLAAVHGQRLGAWLAAAANATPGTEDPALTEARAGVREAIANDANLVELFEELDGIVTSDELRGRAGQQRALWLSHAWNDYLDSNGQPYFWHANVMLRSRPVFYAHVYEVVADARGTVDADPIRLRAVSRLDRLNLRELYLGYASSEEDGAILLADRVAELALDRVWPLLRPDGGGQAPAFAAAVASEARRDLPREAIDVLVATATERGAAVAAHDAIGERRDCSRLWVPPLPWSGYDDEALAQLERFIGAGQCAGVRPSELAALRSASEALRDRPGLEAALEQLVAWAARPVAVHELRHVAEDRARDDDDPERRCGICTSLDPDSVRAEASAYLAALAWSGAPATALYELCVTTEDDAEDEATTVHGRARDIVLAALGWSCRDGIPADLPAAARRIADEAFDDAAPIALSDDFPARLPIVSARDRSDDP